jgi:hypothetical protein
MVCQHQGTGFDTEITSLRILDHTRSQTGRTRRLSTRVYGSG